MPYRHAHYFVGAVLLVIVGGFWATYFSVVARVPLAFHVHAVSSMTWLALLIAQHVAIHRRSNALHRVMGKASFALFPFLILGFVMIIDVSAQAYARAANPFILYNGPAFGAGMVTAIAAYITLFYLALRNRRKVKLHAGYMLATPLILFESPFSRLADATIPWINVIRSGGFHEVLDMIAISNGLAIAFALVLYFRDRKNGAPWLVASAFMALQSVVMWFAPSIPGLGPLFAAYATIPQGVMLAMGLAAGAATAWLGWEAGKAARKSRAVAA